MRQVVLDTETTGLEVRQGHRLVEIACVEMVGRRLTGRYWQTYLNPERAMDEGASQVTGIRDEHLVDKPLFADKVDEFL
ncbi:MAG: DNA polymerase III subunit epsilon, partial [Xanthomonadaceae bacterium]|nr:DNA polymerase III subunit epsilon [Xanthomonadaceae bacterium]